MRLRSATITAALCLTLTLTFCRFKPEGDSLHTVCNNTKSAAVSTEQVCSGPPVSFDSSLTGRLVSDFKFNNIIVLPEHQHDQTDYYYELSANMKKLRDAGVTQILLEFPSDLNPLIYQYSAGLTNLAFLKKMIMQYGAAIAVESDNKKKAEMIKLLSFYNSAASELSEHLGRLSAKLSFYTFGSQGDTFNSQFFSILESASVNGITVRGIDIPFDDLVEGGFDEKSIDFRTLNMAVLASLHLSRGDKAIILIGEAHADLFISFVRSFGHLCEPIKPGDKTLYL